MNKNEKLERLLDELQKELAVKGRPGVSLVDELIKERREGAEREERKWQASRTGHKADKPPTAS